MDEEEIEEVALWAPEGGEGEGISESSEEGDGPGPPHSLCLSSVSLSFVLGTRRCFLFFLCLAVSGKKENRDTPL